MFESEKILKSQWLRGLIEMRILPINKMSAQSRLSAQFK
jgi:hypothetical protein